MVNLSHDNFHFTTINQNELRMINGGIDWLKVGVAAITGGAAGALAGGITFAGAGTVVLPGGGTVAAGVAGAVVCGTVGAVFGAVKSIWDQLW